MKKIGYFFFTFLPFFASIGLQFVVMFPLMGFSMLYICFSGLLSGQKLGYNDLLSQFMSICSNQNFSMIVSIIFAISGALIFGTWYACQFQGSLQFPTEKFSNPKMILGLVLVVPGLQIASALITGFSAFFLPGWMEFYEKLMDNAGFSSSPSLLLILYAVLIGPIEEELTFRGVVLSSAKKAFPFWAANLFQALLFAVFHLNPIQGIYAFFIGLFLGYVYQRSGSIWISALLHILYNGFGTFISGMIEIYSPLPIFLLVVISIAGLCLFHKNTSVSGVNHSPDFSDM